MGAEGSINAQNTANARTSFSNPIVWSESFVQTNLKPEFEETLITKKSILTNSQLMDIYAGAYEQIDNPDDFLETIISNDIKIDTNLHGLALQQAKYILAHQEREVVAFNYKDLRNCLYSPFNFAPTKFVGLSFPIDFSTILKAFENSSKVLFEEKCCDFINIRVLSDYFSSAVPALASNPPSQVFLPQQNRASNLISAPTVGIRGTSSNGQYLFVFSEPNKILSIFPLLNMGSLSEPLTVRLEGLSLANANYSMVSNLNEILFIFEDRIEHIKLQDIINNPSSITITKETLGKKAIKPKVACSDGASLVKVYFKKDQLMASVFEISTGKEISTVQLELNKSRAHSEFTDKNQTDNIPFATNGVFLSCLLRLDQATVINRVFSLVTGAHIIDEIFQCPDQIRSYAIDSINRCIWAINPNDSESYRVYRYQFSGSINPSLVGFNYPVGNVKETILDNKNVFGIFNSVMSRILIHYIGTHFIPPPFIAKSTSLINSLVNLLKTVSDVEPKQIVKYGNHYTLAIQNLAILVDLNLYVIEKTKRSYKDLVNVILGFITMLPINVCVMLFFNHFDFFMKENIDLTLKILVASISQLKEYKHLYCYAFKCLELAEDALVSVQFKGYNQISDLIPQTVISVNEITEQNLILIYIHQRSLVQATTRFLKSNPYTVLEFSSKQKTNPTPLDQFYDYSQNIISKFDAALNTANKQDEIINSVIFKVFENYLRLIFPLTKFHTVAQFLTTLLSVILPNIAKHIEGNNILREVVRLFFMAFGNCAATLVQGGTSSEFEEKYHWLMKPNINLIDKPDECNNLSSHKIEIFDDDRFLKFLGGNTKTMTTIYEKYKKPLHRNLNQEVSSFDRLSLLSLCKHLNLLDELFDMPDRISIKMKEAIDQMIRCRNAYRSLKQQKKSVEILNQKCLALLRMMSEAPNAKALGDFILSDITPEEIQHIIQQQRTRIQMTLIGFSLLQTIYSKTTTKLFTEITTYTLASISKFDGLASIMMITQLTQAQSSQIKQFFDRLIIMYKENHNSMILLVIFRFFRDLTMLTDIHTYIVEQILNIYLDNNDLTALALVLNLLQHSKYCYSHIDQSNQSYYQWLLVTDSLKNNECSREVMNVLISRLIKTKNNYENRILCRALYYAFRSSVVDKKFAEECFDELFKFVHTDFISNGDHFASAEIIWLLREMIVKEHPKKNTLLCCLKQSKYLGCVFAVLGYINEPIRPFCTVRCNQNYSSTAFFTTGYSKEKSDYLDVYSLPFNFNQKPLKLYHDPMTVYAIPSVELDDQHFTDYDYILSFFSKPLDHIIKYLFMQVVAKFSRYQSFVNKLSSEIIKKISINPSCFTSIPRNTLYFKSIKEIKNIPQEQGFNVIYYDLPSIQYKSYLSPLIKRNNEDITMNIHYNEDIFVGIVSDTCEKYQTRYSVIHLPQGTRYPKPIVENNEIRKRKLNLNPDGTINLIIKNQLNLFFVNKESIEFPRGEDFRIIISVHKDKEPILEYSEKDFNENVSSFISIIDEFGDTEKIDDELPAQAPPTTSSIYRRNFIVPPSFIPIHIMYSTHASKPLIETQMKRTYEELTNQFAMIALTRIAANNSQLIIPYSAKIFSTLCIILEPFLTTEFSIKEFPFKLDTPIWEETSPTNMIYMSLENDAKQAIKNILKIEKCVQNISERIEELSMFKHIHIGAGNSLYINFTPYSEEKIKLPPHSITIVNDFNQHEDFPLYVNKNELQLVSPPNNLTTLTVFAKHNLWIFGNIFELILLIKNLIFVVSTINQRIIIKTAILNLQLCQSPFVSPFIPHIFDYLQAVLPSSPLDSNPHYIKKLKVVDKSILGNDKDHENGVFTIKNFIKNELAFFNNKSYKLFYKHFPEFFTVKIDPPESILIQIQTSVSDLDAEKIFDFNEQISMIRLFVRQYPSIKNFPFWYLFKYWVNITERKEKEPRESTQASDEEPGLSIIDNNIRVINNMTRYSTKCRVNVTNFPPNALIMYSPTQTFDDAKYIIDETRNEIIKLNPGKTYFCLVDLSWDQVSFRFIGLPMQNTIRRTTSSDANPNKDIRQIHDAFVADMEQFACQWKPEHTDTLLMQIPTGLIYSPKFAEIKQFALSSSLTQIFSPTVVILRTMLINHYNYIRKFHSDSGKVDKTLLDSIVNFIPQSDAADQVIKSIYTNKSASGPSLSINRHKAQMLICNGSGSPYNSIISQLSRCFMKYSRKEFLGTRPWHVSFVDESAIDAGGPTNELYHETAQSIFEPTTRLCIPLDDHFIPYSPNETRIEEYYAIGFFLGIVARTGINQDIPFANFVWKYIATGQLSAQNIIDDDTKLNDFIRNVRRNPNDNRWYTPDWNHKMVLLDGHTENSIVPKTIVEVYINECLQYRLNKIMPFLKQIRKGFTDNVCFKKHPMLTGPLISYLIQGTPVITTDMLREKTVVVDFDGGINNEYVRRFFRVVDRFNQDQRKLLLRFITTMSRLPNPIINPDFSIKIDMASGDGDEKLPSASTCFNKLHLPQYSTDDIAYQRFNTAIQFCQTMELS